MKRKQFSEEQIIKILAECEAGATGREICRRHGISGQTFYRWKSKYGGMTVSEAKRLRELEAENRKLKQLLGEAHLDNAALKETVIKKLVRPAVKRQAVQHLVDRGLRSQRRAANLVGIHRSVVRHQSCRGPDTGLRERLKALATQYTRHGYETLHGMLKLEGLVINEKRTYRIYREENLQVRRKRRKRLTRQQRVPMPMVTRANQRWSMDFVSDQLATGRRFRIFNLGDDFTRECVGQIVDFSISGERVARYLDEVSTTRELPDEIVLDNGPEMTSKALWLWAQKRSVTLNFIRPGKPIENPFVESFNGKFRDECLNEHWFTDIADARRIIETRRIHYNEERPHSSLDRIPPAMFARAMQSLERTWRH